MRRNFVGINGQDDYPYNMISGCRVDANGKCSCGSNCRCGPDCACGCNADRRRIERFENQNDNMQNRRPNNQTCSRLTVNELDGLCNGSLNQFKQYDEGAMILPGIGLPSQNNGVCTIMHGMGK